MDSTNGSDASAHHVDAPQTLARSPPPAEPLPSTSSKAADSKPGICQEEGEAAPGSGIGQPSPSQAVGARGSASQQQGEGSSISREPSLSSRGEGGKTEGRLAGWKEKLSGSHRGSKDHGDAWGRKLKEEPRKAEEVEGAGRSFTGRMSNMLNAATHSLRPTSARREKTEPSRCATSVLKLIPGVGLC